MSGTKFDKKMGFFPYFPFGYCSRIATTIAGNDNPYAGLYLLGSNPEEVMKKYEQYRQQVLYRARDLCQKHYTHDVNRACGTPSIILEFRALTATGLAVLAECPDYAGALKRNHFYSKTYDAAEQRDTLYAYAESDQEAFHEVLSDAVMDAKLTPLSAAMHLVGGVKISLDKYSSNQRYNIWRQSHIQAMFRANGHLTYLDRRPYDTGFSIDGIRDTESYIAYCAKHGTTLPAYTYHALTTWYQHHPDYYQITQRYPISSEEAQQRWLHTPAFYSSLELPYNNRDTAMRINSTVNGRRQVVNSIHIGLAAGRRVNYACYHAKPGKFKWIPKREQHTKQILELAVRQMKVRNPNIPYNEAVHFALYFCTSYHQFLALFEHTKAKHITYKKCASPTDKPYTSIHVIPVNDSGTILLHHLLERSPHESEMSIVNELIEMDIGFNFSPNYYYPLTYNGKRVFLGHTMEIAKINHALEDHLDGANFYICCFPGQVSWYKHLFPGKAFL